MSEARKHWNKAKGEMELAFGKDFVKKSFSLDLGPTYDEMDKCCDQLEADLTTLEKTFQHLVKTNQSLRELRRNSRTKANAYEKMIVEESKAKKTKHGDQIASVMATVDRIADKRAGLIRGRIFKLSGELSALNNLG